ncbi:MAG: peptide chain release factor 1, partial [Clostridia bacterium]|nr:peptide chain release factor 1 [Clostridia bacterium]
DIRTDIFHSSGAGGQNINKVATAVRLTHIPTGIVVVCKEERSQLQNRNRATAVLYSKLYAYYQENISSSRLKEKREKLSTARTARVRFYDFTALTASDLRTNVTIPLKEAYGTGLNTLINSVLVKER